MCNLISSVVVNSFFLFLSRTFAYRCSYIFFEFSTSTFLSENSAVWLDRSLLDEDGGVGGIIEADSEEGSETSSSSSESEDEEEDGRGLKRRERFGWPRWDDVWLDWGRSRVRFLVHTFQLRRQYYSRFSSLPRKKCLFPVRLSELTFSVVVNGALFISERK